MGRWGDWQKGEFRPEGTVKFNVSYSVAFPDGSTASGKVQIVCRTKEDAGERAVYMIKRREPRARVTIRRIWEQGKTPGGLYLPPGLEWIDDEVEGKGKVPR